MTDLSIGSRLLLLFLGGCVNAVVIYLLARRRIA